MNRVRLLLGLLLFAFHLLPILLVHAVGLTVEVCFGEHANLLVGEILDAELFSFSDLTGAMTELALLPYVATDERIGGGSSCQAL